MPPRRFQLASAVQEYFARPLERPDDLVSLLVTAFAVLRFRDVPDEAVRIRVVLGSGSRRLEVPIDSGWSLSDVQRHVVALLDGESPPSLEPVPGEWALFLAAGGMDNDRYASAVAVQVSLEERPLSLDVAVADGVLLSESHLAGRLSAIAALLIEQPEQHVYARCLLSDEERHELDVSWSAGTRDVPFVPLAQRLSELAQCAPARQAVRAPDGNLTYADLDARASAVAARLLDLGAPPEAKVAVCLPPSADLLPCIFGILRAGAVYVPLDPTHPKARIHAIIGDISPALVLTTRPLASSLELAGFETWCLDERPLAAEATRAPSPPRPVTESTPAYVFYTSGTTGLPKGVVATHGNLAHYLEVARERYHFDEQDVFCSIARSTFSISLFDLLLPTRCGGTLHILARQTVLDPAQLRDALADVTVLHAGPALLKALLAHIEAFPQARSGLEHLHHLSTGGDLVPPDLIMRLEPHTGRADLFVIYGCTEISCMGLTYEIQRGRRLTRSFVGRPFPNVQVRVLDPAGNRVPVGVRGEIVFAGRGVTAGYLDRPEVEAARYYEEDGARWYRTGDVGRIHPTGDLEILGREDFQIQLGGIRIELGEVESVLRRGPGVKDAVVAKRALGASDDAVLVGYVVPAEGSVDLAAVRRFAATLLPDYMVPTVLMELPALPLNLNLKLDRNALPTPERPSVALPPTESEEATLVLETMAEVLGQDSIDLDADLRDLGCSSLTLVAFSSRILARAKVQLPYERLFAKGASLRELGRALRDLKRAGETPRSALAIVEAPERAPLSFSQARIWFADRVQGQGLAYGVPLILELQPGTKVEVLRRALGRTIDRHPVLRTVIEDEGDQIYQRVDDDLVIPLEVLPLAPSQLDAAILSRQAVPFNLSRGPLARAVLFDLGSAPPVLFLLFHHLVMDEASARIFRRELTSNYEAELSGTPSRLPGSKLAFRDYAYSERCHWESGALERDVAYWRARFDTLPEELDLPTDRPRGLLRAGSAASVYANLSATQVTSLRSLARDRGSSLFVLAVATWSALLHRYSGQEEVVVGTAVANRLVEAAESLVGCFINLVPLRLEVSPGSPLGEFLDKATTVCVEALEHSAVPFEEIVRLAAPERDAGGAALFRTLVVFEDQLESNPGSLLSDVRRPALVGALSDLSLWVIDRGERLELALHYDTSLFDAGTAENLVEQLRTGLEHLSQSTEETVGQLSFTSDPAQCQLAAWNRATQRSVRDGSFVDWIFDRAARSPDKVAVVDASEQLTYRQLLARVMEVARMLETAGVPPRSLVGVCVPRSTNLAVATLGILAAGCGYVPLDPSYPQARLLHMIEDSGLAVVLSAGTEALLPDTVRPLPLSRASAPISTQPARQRIDPNSVAYAIYTSGSTGLPKGVLIPHRAVDNFLMAMGRAPGLRSSDVMVSVTTLSFDISVLEIFLPLVQGATVVVATEDQTRDANLLGRLIRESGATYLQSTPVTWRMLVGSGFEFPVGFRGISGGEPLPRDLADSLLAKNVELWNAYGPTETTVWSSCDLVESTGRITVGRPIDNTAFYVLGPSGERQPIGAPGELYIGGLGVTLGYHNRTELTRERFVPDPFQEAPGETMYRTGDRARVLPDGRYEHLGRLDGQIKLRGFRIELGEIEAAVRDLGIARDCAASVFERGSDDRRLVLFVDAAEAPPLKAVRERLSSRLPEYMLPGHVVAISGIPRTENGKVNRKAISALPLELSSEQEAPAARTGRPLELHVAELFARELGGPVHPDDDFFEHGGHSLLAVKVVRHLQNAFGLDFPLGLLFEYRTPRALAELIVTSPDLRPKPILLAGKETLPPIYLLAGVQIYQQLAELISDHFSVYGTYVSLEARTLDSDASHPSVEQLARAYVELILHAQPEGAVRLGGVSFGGVIAYEVARQLARAGRDVTHLLLLDAILPARGGAKLGQTLKRLARLPRAEMLRTLQKRLLSLGRSRLEQLGQFQAVEVDTRVRRLSERRRMAYQLAVEDYHPPGEIYAGRVTLVAAGARLRRDALLDPFCGWKTRIPGAFLAEVDAEHLGILAGTTVEDTARAFLEHEGIASS